jgi:hypothetical protein
VMSPAVAAAQRAATAQRAAARRVRARAPSNARTTEPRGALSLGQDRLHPADVFGEQTSGTSTTAQPTVGLFRVQERVVAQLGLGLQSPPALLTSASVSNAAAASAASPRTLFQVVHSRR